jgi:hypothetical protein
VRQTGDRQRLDEGYLVAIAEQLLEEAAMVIINGVDRKHLEET